MTTVATLPRRPVLILGILCLVTFMTLLDAYGVSLAAPTLQRDLPATLAEMLWVLNGYTLGLVVMPIPAGRLGDRIGPRTVLLAGLALFTVASGGCALAPDAGWLIALRVVQGIGAGLLAPQTLTLITHVFPESRRGWALGVSGAVAGFGVAAGPSLGGVLVAAVGWRGVFAVNLPLGVAALVLIRWLLPNPRRRATDALIPLRLLRNRDFTVVAAVVGSLPAAVSAMMFLLSTYLQSAESMTAYAAGLLLAVAPAVSIPFSHVAGTIVDRRGPRPVLIAGLVLMAAGVAATALAVAVRPPVGFLLPGLVIFGAGMGVVFGAPFVLATRRVPASLVGTASGVFGTAQRLGGMLGLAAAGAVLGAGSIRDALLVPLAMLVAAVLLTVFLVTDRKGGVPLVRPTPRAGRRAGDRGARSGRKC